MVAYCCDLSTQEAEAAGSKTQSQLELQGQTDSKVQEKNGFPYSTFPIIIIYCPDKRVLVEIWSFAVYYNVKYCPPKPGYPQDNRICT